jgi:hypothetical protein
VLDLAWERKPPPLPWYASAAGRTHITIAAAIAIALVAGSANAQNAWQRTITDAKIGIPEGQSVKPPDPLVKQITTSPTPLTLAPKQQTGWAPHLRYLGQHVVLTYEPGGLLNTHVERFRAIAERGAEVEIRGLCQSACTLILGHIPRERLCFSEQAKLNFHLASHADGTASMEHTRWVFGWYPADIKAWINSRGGPEKMPPPFQGFWTLPASELFKMGYRKCPD